MKLYYYRGEAPNFGDELNKWLLPKVFPNFFDDDASTLFLGIGSILFNHHPKQACKVVFGSGFGGYTAPPDLDSKWKVFCVRGPRTARALGLDPSSVAGDAAILMNKFRPGHAPRTVRAAFMPHFQSLFRGHWRHACALARIQFVDPRDPVECVLKQILETEVLVTEAMHGAIVADALRVPWVPIEPFDEAHRFKWYDWAEALDMRLEFRRLMPSSLSEALLQRRKNTSLKLQNAKGLLKAGLALPDAALVASAAYSLRRAASSEPSLSLDKSLDRAVERLSLSAERILQEFS